MALTADDKKWIAAEIRAAVRAELRTAMPDVPTATENADAIWRKTRSDPRPPWSDTARNLLGAEITEAVQAGVAIERYPYNEGK